MITPEISTCPICVTTQLTVHSLRQRVLIFKEEEEENKKKKLMIRRLFCAECKRIHHELPECIVPYKRHCAETIKKLIKDSSDSKNASKTDYVPCGRETVWRILKWWRIMGLYFIEIYKSIAEKNNKYDNSTTDLTPSFKALVRAACNSNNWNFASLIFTRSATTAG